MDKYVTQISSPTGFPLLRCGTRLALSQAFTLGLTAALSFPVLRGEEVFKICLPKKGINVQRQRWTCLDLLSYTYRFTSAAWDLLARGNLRLFQKSDCQKVTSALFPTKQAPPCSGLFTHSLFNSGAWSQAGVELELPVRGLCLPAAERSPGTAAVSWSRGSLQTLHLPTHPRRCLGAALLPLPRQWIKRLLTALLIRRENRTKCKLQLCCMDQKGSLFQQFLVLNSAAIKGNTSCFRAYLYWKELLNKNMAIFLQTVMELSLGCGVGESM